jgi:alkaline phosphatase
MATEGRATEEKETEEKETEGMATNIILFIGDGMGLAHLTGARLLAEGPSGSLSMDSMPVNGFARTQSSDRLVTDSAAAATAIASGVKTYNKAIGVDAAGNSVPTILELARARGKATGLVTNTQIAHATPAAFASHVVDRSMMTEIARQLLDRQVDVLLGGGEDEWLPADQAGCYPEKGERDDGLNLVELASTRGYTYVCTAEQFSGLESSAITRLLGLFADEGMLRPHQPSLADLTRMAIEILSRNPNGFFLMVEGGQIDWASESNDAANTLGDVINFDIAVAVGREFAARDQRTLVIVTGDHESGGLSLLKPGISDTTFTTPDGTDFGVRWANQSHTSVDVPVLAEGPHAWKLNGSYQNTHLYEVMAEAVDN